jgi:cell division protein FtsZ
MIRKFTSIEEVSNLTKNDIFKPQIAVIGIGGAGSNALNNMIELGLSGVKFVVINTDAQALENSLSPNKIQIGPKVTKGLGAGSKPEIGVQSAEESTEEIKKALENINMLFIACGMGGGTGTGASQVVAKIAKEMGILTIAFVTTPFDFEGNQRLDIAKSGVIELEKYVDSMLVISNENLFNVIEISTSFFDAFRIMDGVLFSAVKSIVELISGNGLVNLDFNDIKSVLEGAGRTMIGSAEAEGENRAQEVVRSATINPLLEDSYLKGAKKALINITGSNNMTLHEINTIIKFIKQELSNDAFINFGTVYDNKMGDTIRLSIVATGLDSFITTSGVGQNVDKSMGFKPRLEQKFQPKIEKNFEVKLEQKFQSQVINSLENNQNTLTKENVKNENQYIGQVALNVTKNSIPLPEITPEITFIAKIEPTQDVNNEKLIEEEILQSKQEQIRKLKESKGLQTDKLTINNSVQNNKDIKLNDIKNNQKTPMDTIIDEDYQSRSDSLFEQISKDVNPSLKNNFKDRDDNDGQNDDDLAFTPKIRDRNNIKNDKLIKDNNDKKEGSFFEIPSFLKKS